MADKPTVSVIGAGRLGLSLAFILQKEGYQVAAVSSRSEESRQKARDLFPGTKIAPDNSEAAKNGEVVFITVNDDAVAEVCREIASAGGFKPGQIVFHTSGALPLSVLQPASGKGAETGSIHPVQTFVSFEKAARMLPETVFGITASGKALKTAKAIVSDIGGTWFEVDDADKALYHAAATVVCNYFITLLQTGVEYYKLIGLDEKTSLRALLPLTRGVIENVEENGVKASLTGPIKRGDAGIIKRHLEAIAREAPESLAFYREAGKLTLEIARRTGLEKEKAGNIEKLLNE